MEGIIVASVLPCKSYITGPHYTLQVNLYCQDLKLFKWLQNCANDEHDWWRTSLPSLHIIVNATQAP